MQESLNNTKILFNNIFIENQNEALKKAIEIENNKLNDINQSYNKINTDLDNNILNMSVKDFINNWYKSLSFNDKSDNKLFFIGLTLITISLMIYIII